MLWHYGPANCPPNPAKQGLSRELEKVSEGGWLQQKGREPPMLPVSEATELIIHMTQPSPALQTSPPFSSLLTALAGQQLLV